MTFQSVNTRGFATFANTRFVQLVDGMDNSTPALNFPIGNLVGMNEVDVQSVELLPGAASALYGANAFNGILFMIETLALESLINSVKNLPPRLILVGLKELTGGLPIPKGNQVLEIQELL